MWLPRAYPSRLAGKSSLIGSGGNEENTISRTTTALDPALFEYTRMFARDGAQGRVVTGLGDSDTFMEETMLRATKGSASVALTQFHFRNGWIQAA